MSLIGQYTANTTTLAGRMIERLRFSIIISFRLLFFSLVNVKHFSGMISAWHKYKYIIILVV